MTRLLHNKITGVFDPAQLASVFFGNSGVGVATSAGIYDVCLQSNEVDIFQPITIQ